MNLGQIQCLLFWIAVIFSGFDGWSFWILWIISLFFNDQKN